MNPTPLQFFDREAERRVVERNLPHWSQARGLKAFDAPLLPNNFVETNSGISVVVPAWRVAELLNSPQFVAERERIDKER